MRTFDNMQEKITKVCNLPIQNLGRDDAKKNVKKFSDFCEEPAALDGKKVRIDDIVNQEILITGYNIKISKYGENKTGKYLTLQFATDGSKESRVLFTGSDVLIDQLERYGDEIPFLATIKRVNRYYTLS